jgi:hypothetical protein
MKTDIFLKPEYYTSRRTTEATLCHCIQRIMSSILTVATISIISLIIQLNSILIYLRANSTAQEPITKWAWVKETHIKYKAKAIYNIWYVYGD